MKKPARKAGTTRRIGDLAELDRLACACARELGLTPAIVHLEGPLGVGKTTFVRYWLQHLGISDSVRSPSFTLLECYEQEGQRIVHTDLFRLRGASELENLGLRDYVGEALIFIEWPERGEWATPPPGYPLCVCLQRYWTLRLHRIIRWARDSGTRRASKRIGMSSQRVARENQANQSATAPIMDQRPAHEGRAFSYNK